MGFPSHPEQSSAPGQLVSQTQIRSVDLETLDPERIDLEMLSEFVNFSNPTLAIHFPILVYPIQLHERFFSWIRGCHPSHQSQSLRSDGEP